MPCTPFDLAEAGFYDHLYTEIHRPVRFSILSTNAHKLTTFKYILLREFLIIEQAMQVIISDSGAIAYQSMVWSLDRRYCSATTRGCNNSAASGS